MKTLTLELWLLMVKFAETIPQELLNPRIDRAPIFLLLFGGVPKRILKRLLLASLGSGCIRVSQVAAVCVSMAAWRVEQA